jgi:hypothetical protein
MNPASLFFLNEAKDEFQMLSFILVLSLCEIQVWLWNVFCLFCISFCLSLQCVIGFFIFSPLNQMLCPHLHSFLNLLPNWRCGSSSRAPTSNAKPQVQISYQQHSSSSFSIEILICLLKIESQFHKLIEQHVGWKFVKLP